ncbi:DUF1214 domain-containing protein [Microbulbifer litoralis]|uniref:DUF1214 domain-containing protein n=1 Tax=Microbulbifer litoralis TaxID=2933965 RepID=UPI003CE5BDC4
MHRYPLTERGSTTLYPGPEAPPGKEANWLATPPDRAYFAILRLYSPTEAAIEKSWIPGDIEKGWGTERETQCPLKSPAGNWQRRKDLFPPLHAGKRRYTTHRDPE